MTPIPAPDPAACTPPGLFCLACSRFPYPSPVRFLRNALPYKPYQEYSITVRGRPTMGTRILLMLLCLGILSAVMACAVAPPPAVTPPSTAAPPATPAPSDLPPSVVPLPYAHPPY